MQGEIAVCSPVSHSEVIGFIRAYDAFDPNVLVNLLYVNKNVDGVRERRLKGVRFSKGLGSAKAKKEVEFPVEISVLISSYTTVSRYVPPREIEVSQVEEPLYEPEKPVIKIATKRYSRSVLDDFYNVQHRIVTIKRNRPPRRLKRTKP